MSAVMTDLTITGVKRTVDETRELIRRLHEIGNPQLSLKLEELSVVDDLYFFHVVIGKEKVLHLKLKLNFGPADFHLTYDQVHLIEKPYEESIWIWFYCSCILIWNGGEDSQFASRTGMTW